MTTETLNNIEKLDEIGKLAAVGRIKNQIADLIVAAPELNLSNLMEFIQDLAAREIERRTKN
ncbi:MAG TPA: hypothetical protein VEA37_12170 [Flavobacterium sp.]|nr:hypothetical protein [Flavobacterium sp.]